MGRFLQVLASTEPNSVSTATTTLTAHHSQVKCLAPPQNFRIARKVGPDSLLVSWNSPHDEKVSGYMVSSATYLLNRHIEQAI